MMPSLSTKEKIIKKIKQDGLNGDIDVLYYSKSYNSSLKNSYYFQFLPTEVKKVDSGFYINDKLEIAVSSLKNIPKEINIPKKDLFNLYEGAIIHENMHVLGFPMIARAKEVLSIFIEYLIKRNVKIDNSILSNVENIVSDVINEVLAEKQNIDNGKIPITRFYYVLKGKIENKDRRILEKEFPLVALFYKHNEVFGNMFLNKKVKRGNYKSDVIYSLIEYFSTFFNIDKHLRLNNTGRFTIEVLYAILEEYNIYTIMDKVYEWYKNTDIKTNKNDREKLLSFFDDIPPDEKLYALYYALVSALYRITIENNDNNSESSKQNSKNKEDKDNKNKKEKKEKRPTINSIDTINLPIPSKDEALDFTKKIRTMNISLSPEEVDKISEKLLNEIITVKGTKILSKQKSGEVLLPFYKSPRGHIDPYSIIKSQRGFLDWEVSDEVDYYSYKYEYNTSSAPEHFTAVMDISGSTLSGSSILLPFVGMDTTIFDTERAIVLSLMKLTKRYGDERTRASVYLFEDYVSSFEGKIDEMINLLINKKGVISPGGGTNIIVAVKKALEKHKDAWNNPFMIITDLAITKNEEKEIYNLLISELKRSPLIIIIIGEEKPTYLEKLNREELSAVVTINTLNDLKKLEKAMKKISKILARYH